MDRQPKSAVSLMVVGLVCLALGYLFAAPVLGAKESTRARKPALDAFRAATIDMAQLYKSDPKFTRLREELASEIRTAEGEVKAKSETLEGKKRLLQKMPQTSDNFKRLKSEIEIDAALLQNSVQEQKASLTKREAEIYWNCHQDMAKVIEEYCDQQGIQMVVRTTKDPIDPANPQAILQGLNRQIVFDKGIDITEPILEQLKARADRQADE